VVSVLIWKLRIAVLWIFLAVCQSAGMVLLLFQPGAIRGLMAGELWGYNTHSAGAQLGIALSFFIPMAMAYLTLVLKDAANRRTNAVLGVVWAVGSIAALVGQPAGISAGAGFVVIVTILVALLIVWHARKWPRPAEAVPPAKPGDAAAKHEVSVG
jgi:MFS family permease